ncbi:Monoacylglycerol lipase ABHD12 [Podospora fimiseda]|uniref:Monoacylglycerol lipase ABHD12 n=1 Tax=Podospora fimiseda TaxID=252190 RepID=A0AAN7GYU8_9PEZI|nr:Monoacylglycerol lipase ABHD12 [Podospora fimiseda]
MANKKIPKPVSSKMTNKAPYLAVGITAAVPLAIYSLFLGLAAIPFFQRHFLYAHKFSTIWLPGTNLNKPEKWGFAKNQATPFTLTTPDNQTLYAWHILPLSVYHEHEATLTAQPTGLSQDITTTENFKLLRDDPSAKLIISFHGNAGHLLQTFRPRLYHTLSSSNYHVLALSYRGFGHSTGSPTENGLILDAATAITFALKTAGIPPSRIVLLSHSLGTAVASGASELFTIREGVDFAGVVLVAPFSSLPTMLSGYSIAGFVPVLRPLAWWPWGLKKVMDRVVDKWDSAGRWGRIVKEVADGGRRLRLSLVHAKNDWDIPCHEDDKLFRAAVGALIGDEGDHEWFEREKEARTVSNGKDAFVSTWRERDVEVRQELVPWGGHNDVAFSAPVLLAIMGAFDEDAPDNNA